MESLKDDLTLGFDDVFFQSKECFEVYHYTSEGALDSILFKERKLWASEYSCVNDKSEGTVAQSVFERVCNRLWESNRIQETLYQCIAKLKSSERMMFAFEDKLGYHVAVKQYRSYIVCFSADGDSLNMWRYYTKESGVGGYNIGFSPNAMKECFQEKLTSYGVTCLFRNVIYDSAEQEAEVERFILWLNSCFKDNPEDREIAKNLMEDRLAKWKLFFKDSRFSSESEVRLVVMVPEPLTLEKNGRKTEPYPIYKRDVHGFCVPYIKIPISHESVTSVMIGPVQEHAKIKQTAMMRKLRAKEYRSTLVGISDLPIRY